MCDNILNKLNERIFFSVVIPTRNRPTEFKEALESVLAQQFDSFEVIVVNDGTSSEFREAYDRIEESCPNNVQFIHLIERSRGHGHCFARNQGVDASHGNFICFLDDDDCWLDQTFLARAACEITAHSADFYFANQKAITHDGKLIEHIWVEDLPMKLDPSDPRLRQTVFPVTVRELLLANGFPHMNCWAISKDIYNQIDGMDENLRYEPDRDIYIRALDKAQLILYDKTIVSLHNIPDPEKKINASTLTSAKQKLLFQLRTNDKGILFSTRRELINSCLIGKGYLLKRLAELLAGEKSHKLAYVYAREALAVSFNLKWLLFTMLCWIKSIVADEENA